MANVNEAYFNLIPNYIYFYHIDKYCILPMYPESINDSLPISFTPTQALGRSAPVQTFSNSGPRSINITLELHRDIMNDINKDNILFLDDLTKTDFVKFDTKHSYDYVDVLINHLESMSVPKYQVWSSTAKGIIPPQIAVRFGDDIFIKGVPSGVSVNYKKPIITYDDGRNKYACVTVVFTITEVDPYDAESVLELGSFRKSVASSILNGTAGSIHGALLDSSRNNHISAYTNTDINFDKLGGAVHKSSVR